MDIFANLPKDIRKLISQCIFHLGEFSDEDFDDMNSMEKKFLIDLLKKEKIFEDCNLEFTFDDVKIYNLILRDEIYGEYRLYKAAEMGNYNLTIIFEELHKDEYLIKEFLFQISRSENKELIKYFSKEFFNCSQIPMIGGLASMGKTEEADKLLKEADENLYIYALCGAIRGQNEKAIKYYECRISEKSLKRDAYMIFVEALLSKNFNIVKYAEKYILAIPQTYNEFLYNSFISENFEIFKYIYYKSAKTDFDEERLLDNVIRHDNIEILQFLCKNVFKKKLKKLNPDIIYPVRYGKFRMVKYLLENFKFSKEDINYYIEKAEEKHNFKMVDLLKNYL